MEADFARNPDWLPALDVAAACGTSEVHVEAATALMSSEAAANTLIPEEAAALLRPNTLRGSC
jgi:hypothetical protein